MKFLIISLSFVCFTCINGDLIDQSKTIRTIFKFKQQGYKLIHHIFEVSSFDESIFSNVTGLCYPYNRTSRTINLTLSFKTTETDVKIHVQAYKFMSNEYRYFPATFEFDYWVARQQDYFDFAALSECGNMPDRGSFQKGKTYRIRKWIPDPSKFPPHIPLGDYKIELKLIYHSVIGATINWYGSVMEIH